MTEPQTAVILLNWNGWQDTVACVASLLESESQNFVIVICDNASTDDSWQQISSWCEANAQGGFAVGKPESYQGDPKKITLLQTAANLGFAGGCNVGIRFALQHTACEYLWLLNNDTLVAPDALACQLLCMQRDSNIGLLGSVLVYADHRSVVQCFGGYGFNFWTARVRTFPFPPAPEFPPSAAQVERRMRYVSGASTFTTRRFVEQVGLLNEQYFLYFEEIDWAVRGRAFRLSYCPESIVFHKEGSSIGSSRAAISRSAQSEHWLTRNRILFTRTHFPLRTPITVLWVIFVAAVRACTGRWRMSAVLLRGLWNGLRAPVKPLPRF